MALSNIFRQPRREITETLVGAGIVLPILAAAFAWCWWWAPWMQSVGPAGSKGEIIPFAAAMAFVGLATAAVTVLGMPVLFLIHVIGEHRVDVWTGRGSTARTRRLLGRETTLDRDFRLSLGLTNQQPKKPTSSLIFD